MNEIQVESNRHPFFFLLVRQAQSAKTPVATKKDIRSTRPYERERHSGPISINQTNMRQVNT